MNKAKNGTYYVYNKIAAAGVAALICIFPLFITNGYLNITASKYHFFCISTVVFAVITEIAYLCRTDRADLRKREQRNYTDIFMLVFLAVCILSFWFSDYRRAAFTGNAGRMMGLKMMLIMILAYFFISRSYKLRYREIDLLAVSFIIMCAFAVIQFMGFDPLDLLSVVAVKKRVAFISFSGNINVFASYVCIAVPMFMYLFCTETAKKRKILYCCAVVFGFFGVFASDSDAGILGLAAAFLIVFMFCCRSTGSFSEFWLLGAAFSISSLLFRVLSLIFINQCRSSSPMYSALLEPRVFLATFCICVLLYLLSRRFTVSDKGLKIIRILFITICALLFFGFFAAIVYYNVSEAGMPQGFLSGYLRFDDSWGSERGTVWRKLCEAYLDFPIIHKIFGSGEDTVALVLKAAESSAVKTSAGQVFDNAHNELLQYLITLGGFGVLAYLLCVGTAVRSAAKSGSFLRQASSICVCVYFVQSFVTITQPITTPLLFVFLGMTQAKEYK